MDIIITGILTLLIGGTATYFLWDMMLTKKKEKLLADAEVQAEVLKEKKMLQAKEKFLQLKSEHETYINERNLRISGTENKLKQKEAIYLQRKEELQRSIKDFENSEREIDSIRENLNVQLDLVEQKEEEMQKLHKQQVQQLEALSGLSADEAKSQLIDSLKNEAKTEAMSFIQEIMDEAKMTANKEAKKIIVKSIQRVASETAIENSVTVFHIESDEIKGRIIGREGRNIRALEAATGVEIIVDDTPEAIVLSAFDPVRREIARLALHQLVTDGRIHPARIEEVVNKVKKQIEEEIIETGKRTTIDLGVHGLHPELIRLIGKMKYRSSYGQNLLQHSRETANLCAIMAAELGLNPKLGAHEQALTVNQAATMVEMMKNVINRGTGTRLRRYVGYDSEFAGKTGTTQENSDGWFICFNPRLVTGAWVGAESPKVHFRSMYLGQGSAMALPIVGNFWHSMAKAGGKFQKILLEKFPVPKPEVLASLGCQSWINIPPDSFFVVTNVQDSTLRDSLVKYYSRVRKKGDPASDETPGGESTIDPTEKNPADKPEDKEKKEGLIRRIFKKKTDKEGN